MVGGGGTDITVAFDRVLEDMAAGQFEFDVVVCMTDGYTPWPADPFPIPVVTMLVGAGAHPEWLKVSPHALVKIDPD
jgi:predicted metal-dependent peptidase